jgi:hypothetical protein
MCRLSSVCYQHICSSGADVRALMVQGVAVIMVPKVSFIHFTVHDVTIHSKTRGSVLLNRIIIGRLLTNGRSLLVCHTTSSSPVTRNGLLYKYSRPIIQDVYTRTFMSACFSTCYSYIASLDE